MKGIRNERFWSLWSEKRYEEAMACSAAPSVMAKEERVRGLLFGGRKQMQQTAAIAAISAGEFLYDYVRLDPAAVSGIDFARKEDLSSLFSLSEFAKTVDTGSVTGDMAQLQGYTAERMMAAELQARGHDVEFPETSNQAGYDLLVDGTPFQVKNLAGPQGVRVHLERYPDIPVLVNEELSPYFEGNPNVYPTAVSHEDVLAATGDTLKHAADLSDFEIPYITFIVHAAVNSKRLWKSELSLEQAVIHTLADSTARIAFAGLGKMAGTAAGTALFGPPYVFLSAGMGAVLFGSQSYRASDYIKRAFAKKEMAALRETAADLSGKAEGAVEEKLEIKTDKMRSLKAGLDKSEANRQVYTYFRRLHEQDLRYMTYKQKELNEVTGQVIRGHTDILDGYRSIMKTIPKLGVHPSRYSGTLLEANQAFLNLRKKL